MADQLSEESLRHVEAGVATHRAVVELSEQRRARLEHYEQELKLLTIERDHLQMEVHDAHERMQVAQEVCEKAIAARVAYETLVLVIARTLTEFVPPTPPLNAHKPEEVERENKPTPPRGVYGASRFSGNPPENGRG